jgi:hypothetical protein
VTYNIGKAQQTITFPVLPDDVDIQALPFELAATASSGLPVGYVSSNPDVASISNNTVTILAAGKTVITASQTGNANYEAAAAVSQTLTVIDTGTGITGNARTEITFYPNPATDVLYITGQSAIEQVDIIRSGGTTVSESATGSRALTTTGTTTGSRALTVSIPVGNLPAGIYLVKVKTAEGIIIRKIIKK